MTTNTMLPVSLLRRAYNRAYRRFADDLAPLWGRNLPSVKYMRVKGEETDLAGYMTQVALRMRNWLDQFTALFADETSRLRAEAQRKVKHERRHPQRRARAMEAV